MDSNHEMKLVLMIVEKPKMAWPVAWNSWKYLNTSGSKFDKRPVTDFGYPKFVHEFVGAAPANIRSKFGTTICKYKVVTVYGNVTAYDFVDPVMEDRFSQGGCGELFTEPVGTKEVNMEKRVLDFLRIEAKDCDYLILWLDCDKPGENICYQIINALGWKNRMDHVYRARFSAVEEADIKKALDTLDRPDKKQALQIDALRILDLRVGCSFSRFFDQRWFRLCSYGPCITPALALVVNRFKEIKKFVPKTVNVVEIVLQKRGSPDLKIAKEVGSEMEAIEIKKRVMDRREHGAKANVAQVSTTDPILITAPFGLTTFELMRLCSKELDVGPDDALVRAEELYAKSLISYPRTETTTYPKDIKKFVKSLLAGRQFAEDPYRGKKVVGLVTAMKGLLKDPTWGCELQESLSPDAIPWVQGTLNAGCHPPIMPTLFRWDTENVDEINLTKEQRELYALICKYFFASNSQDCKYCVTKVLFEIGEDHFEIKENKIVEKGFTALLPTVAVKEENLGLSSLKEGYDRYDIASVKIFEKTTSPPDLMSESELITEMETYGIGTNGTLATHINELTLRKYVTVKEGRRLEPTDLGIILIEMFEKVDPELISPEVRGLVEKALNSIEDEKSFEEIMQKYLALFGCKFTRFAELFRMVAKALNLDGLLVSLHDPKKKMEYRLRLEKDWSICDKEFEARMKDQNFVQRLAGFGHGRIFPDKKTKRILPLGDSDQSGGQASSDSGVGSTAARYFAIGRGRGRLASFNGSTF